MNILAAAWSGMVYCTDFSGEMPFPTAACKHLPALPAKNGHSMSAQTNTRGDIAKSVGFLLAKAYQRALVIFKEHFEGYDLTPQQYGLLGFLWQEDGITQAELSAKSQIDRTTMGGLIDRLEKEGLVVRRSHPEDRRAYRICLTEKGKALEPVLIPIAARAQEQFVAKLNPQEVETLTSLLEKIRN
jgi:MarR family transcriptional regulator, lower aerobic nicotinate degradation pathway regulator